MASQTESAAHVAARVIPAIGRAEFPEQLLSAYRDLAECDLCSVFLWDEQNGPQLLFAAGMHPDIPGFALSASHAYAQTYWRLDAMALRRIHDDRGLSLLRMTAADIRNIDYRRDCYQRGGISERLTLLDSAGDTGGPTLSVNGYRTVSRGPTPSLAVARMEEAGPTLVAALRRHYELTAHEPQGVVSTSRNDLSQRAREWGLSAREAEVVAGLATGHSQTEIAMGAGLTLNSVITYRRRAYQKLKVADRQELRALCERMMAPAAP